MMKKIIALLLALVMVFALVACGGGSDNKGDAGKNDADTSANSDNSGEDKASEPNDAQQAAINTEKVSKPYPHANEDGTPDLDKIAHYDIEYDYSQNPKFKTAYVASSSYFLYQAAADAIESWCPLFNLEWMGFKFNNDGDANSYMTILQQVLDDGAEILIVDPDATIYPSVNQLIAQYPEVKWMPMMSPSRDGAEGPGIPDGGNKCLPFVGFDSVEVGHSLVDKIYGWLQENYPDADPKEVGCIAFDFSTSPMLHVRAVAAEEQWKKIAGESADNFWICDCVSAGLSYEGAKQVFPGEIAKHTEIKYWLVAGIIDDWALAAADTLEEAGLTDTSISVTFGGTGFFQQWDEGIHTAARYALFTAQTLYDEPILGAAYAFKMGWCTPDEIWPSWVDPNDCGTDGHTYSTLLLPTVWLSEEDYVPYLKWTDVYGNTNIYSNLKGYADTEVAQDAFSPFVTEFPSYYTGPKA